MLSESFIASIGVPEKAVGTHFAKDAGIFIHEYQPVLAQKSVLKKSASTPHCLAVSDSHIFAAQAGKAVIHVYSREKGNHEATVPFTERLSCITLACEDCVLVLGTTEGRILLWELGTGRLVTTDQSHLQKVTVVKVDPTSNFLLSASVDATVHVWSLPALLSFSDNGMHGIAPLRTFNSHRTEVAALALGHSSSSCNFALSASTDKTCLIWDFHTNTTLRTILLTAIPTSVVLDAADRYAYIGYQNGSVQKLDLITRPGKPADNVLNAVDPLTPIQPSKSSIMRSPDVSNGAVLDLDVAFDGCTLITGHESGSILAWDVGKGRFLSNLLPNALPGPVTNLRFLPISGLPNPKRRSFRIPAVIKPKFGAFDKADGGVPVNYTLHAELLESQGKTLKARSMFHEALTAPSFPTALLDKGMFEIATWDSTRPGQGRSEGLEDNGDYMALDGQTSAETVATSTKEQIDTLRSEVEALRRLQTASFSKIERLNAENKAFTKRENHRLARLAAHSSDRNGIVSNGVYTADNASDVSSDED